MLLEKIKKTQKLSKEAKQHKDEYTKNWSKINTRKFTIQLRVGRDDELINAIESTTNKNEMFKSAIKAYLKIK